MLQYIKNNKLAAIWLTAAVLFSVATAASLSAGLTASATAIVLTLYMLQVVLPAQKMKALWTLIPLLAALGGIIWMHTAHIAAAEWMLNGCSGYCMGLFVAAAFSRILPSNGSSKNDDAKSKDSDQKSGSDEGTPKQ